jgi:hypothetical protein
VQVVESLQKQCGAARMLAMATKKDRPELTQAEIVQRRDSAVRKALNTPPKPHSGMKLGKRPQSAPAPPKKR